jgi:drug/metabolite transporter (DMT)-like permease
VACCALYTVLARQTGLEADSLPSLAVQQTAALAWALALSPLEGWLTGVGSQLPGQWSEWAGSVASGVLYYAVAFWFYLYGLSRVRASLAGVMLNLTPVFGVGGAVLFLGERLAPTQWLGAGLLVASMALIMRKHAEQSVPVVGA